MRSNWETFQNARQQVLTDLQNVSRHARGIAPVVNPEDIGIIRNIIRPAMELGKFGSAGILFLQTSPYLCSYDLVKQAGFWEDWGSGAWEGLKDIGSGLLDVGAGVGKTLAAPGYMVYRAIRGGQDEGAWGALKGLGKGLIEGPVQLASGVGNVGGGLTSVMVPYARTAGVDLPVLGRTTIADIGREAAPFLIPGGGALLKGLRGIGLASDVGRLGQLALGAPKALGIAGGVANAIGSGLDTARLAQPQVAQGNLLPPEVIEALRASISQSLTGTSPGVGPMGGWMGAGRRMA